MRSSSRGWSWSTTVAEPPSLPLYSTHAAYAEPPRRIVRCFGCLRPGSPPCRLRSYCIGSLPRAQADYRSTPPPPGVRVALRTRRLPEAARGLARIHVARSGTRPGGAPPSRPLSHAARRHLQYLPGSLFVLIGQADLMKALYTEVLIPETVAYELNQRATPELVRRWITHRPSWLQVVPVPAKPASVSLAELHRGEHDAILLALHLKADLMLMDDREGVEEAR